MRACACASIQIEIAFALRNIHSSLSSHSEGASDGERKR